MTNWEAVCDSIRTKLQELLDASSVGEESYKQSRHALRMLEVDLRGWYEQAPRPRGARYCLELTFAAWAGHRRDYLLDLYRDAGAVFMLDPAAEAQEEE